MLSLARKPGQKIRIGKDIVIVIGEIRGRQVRVRIEAPPHVRVLREEIFEAISQENLDAIDGLELAEVIDCIGSDEK